MAVTMHPLGFIGEAEGIETGVYPRQWDCEAGDVIKGHAHGMPHATLVASGRFQFTDERTGATREVGPLTWLPVAAHDLHGFECLEDGTILLRLRWLWGGHRVSWIKEFNFRLTIAYVTDGTDETYVLGDGADVTDEATVYPIPRNGVTFGYVTESETVSARNRNAGIDRRLAGMNFTQAPAVQTFRIDLPAAGDYIVRLASGDYYGAWPTGRLEILDTASSKLVIDHGSGFTSGANFRDATDAEYSAAAWPGSNSPVTINFATTICNVVLGSATRWGWLAHFSLEQVGAAAIVGALTVTLAAATLAAAGTLGSIPGAGLIFRSRVIR